MTKLQIILLSCFFTLSLGNLKSATYYSDPVNGSMSNSGTMSSPYASLELIANSNVTFNGGDSIILLSGNHGFPKINDINTNDVYITTITGQNPIIERIYLGNSDSAAYWHFSNITFQSTNSLTYAQPMISLYSNTFNITIEKCTIQSTTDPLSWDRFQWRDSINGGIRLRGNSHTVKDNFIQYVTIGVTNEAPNSLVTNNLIQFFIIDGMRGLADNSEYSFNTIRDNCVVYAYSENHYDAFQSYSTNALDTLSDVIIKNNLVINYYDVTNPWPGNMQGIVCFDGYIRNWEVTNNVVFIDHWHGISLYGTFDSKIINNTVIDPFDVTPIVSFDPGSTATTGPSWIRVTAHKNGDSSRNNTVRNNISASLSIDPNSTQVDHNITTGSSSNYSLFFEDAFNFDAHLKSTSIAIDSGSSLDAPPSDFEGNSRPQNSRVDVGAYEYMFSTTSFDELNQVTTYNIFNHSISVNNISNYNDYIIYDQKGNLITKGKIISNTKITVPSLANGIYYMVMTNKVKNRTESFKLLKNN